MTDRDRHAELDRDPGLDHDAELDALDDDALRQLAYGRSPSPTERMRADRAARILATRAARARTADAIPAGAAPAPAPSPRAAGAADGAPLLEEDAADADDDARAARARRRGTVAALAIGALVAGVAVGAAIEPVSQSLAPDSLAVFDRAATEAEEALARQVGGSEGGNEVRLLTTVGATEIYALRSAGFGYFGTEDLGESICVIATEPNRSYFPQSCVPVRVFAERGLTGFLPGFSGGDLQDIDTVLSFTWGPRGDIDVSDDSAALLPPLDERYSDEERALGLDIGAIRVLEGLPQIDGSDAQLQRAEIGPAQISSVGSSLFLGTVEPRSGDGRQVCLYSLVAGAVRASVCASLDLFRQQGLRGSFEIGTGTVDAVWLPDGTFTADAS